ncbi:MAG: hypothetical protein ABIY52_12090 [Gemmatimonadaceae bacterium]
MQTRISVPAEPQAPVAPRPAAADPYIARISERQGRIIVDRQGDRTIITSAALPPEMMMLVQRAEETAFGLMGMLLAIVILGPFARMWARRSERRAEMAPVASNNQLLQGQLLQLQQSMDAMSVEVERISESQRFQHRLMNESRSESYVKPL